MDTLAQSQMFFFISSVGFVTFWVFLSILIIYLIRAVYIFSRILEKVEYSIDTIGDTTKELINEIKNSALINLLNFFFKKKRKPHKGSK